VLRQDREVLGVDHLARALARLPPGQGDQLVAGLRTLDYMATMPAWRDHPRVTGRASSPES
jgi:hypothetical protein